MTQRVRMLLLLRQPDPGTGRPAPPAPVQFPAGHVPGRSRQRRPLLAQETASITAQAAFATKHPWVTPAHPDERRAAGDFPSQHPGGAGLPARTAAGRPVTGTGIVLWHTVGATHCCRPEDFPVMPVEYVGFTLKPFGFFDRTPAIDLAPSVNGHCRM